ncbi:MAG: hypothetical protein HC804_00795 [Anaerolineae bacterium]|nr:hypothetical protein [Anaerolineae bacterium]
MIHSLHPRPLNPLVSRNPYRKQGLPETAVPLPSITEAKKLLPEPVLPGREEWTALYWRAWEILWANLHQPAPESGFVSPYISLADGDCLLMWEAAMLTQPGLYGRRAFDFIGHSQ